MNISKKNFLCFFLILIIFLFYRLYSINYGLPYSANQDETSFITSTLYFFKLFLNDENRNLIDPLISPFANAILSSLFIFIKKIQLSLNFLETKYFLYDNPDFFLKISRINSTLINLVTLIFVIKIFNKLKIKKEILLIILFLFAISFIQISVSQTSGKNSLANFFYIAQYYYLTKLIFFKENKAVKIKLVLIGVLAFNTNYICAFPTVLYFFINFFFSNLKKKKEFLKKNFFFICLFIFGSILIDLFFNQSFFEKYIYRPERISGYGFENRFDSILYDLKSFFLLILNFDSYVILTIILIVLNLEKVKKNKKILIFNLILFIFPIFFIAFADTVRSNIRYLSFSSSLNLIALGIVLNCLNIKELKNIFFLIILILFNLSFTTINHYKLLRNTTIQESIIFIKKNNFEENTIIDLEIDFYRLNLNSLRIRKILLERKIISVPDFMNKKNDLNNVNLLISNIISKNYYDNKNYLNSIIINRDKINNFKLLLNYLTDNNINYYLIKTNNNDDEDLDRKKRLNYLEKNYKKIYEINQKKYFKNKRSIKNINNLLNLNKYGPDIAICEIKN